MTNRPSFPIRIAALALVGVAAVGCSQSDEPAATAATTTAVTITTIAVTSDEAVPVLATDGEARQVSACILMVDAAAIPAILPELNDGIFPLNDRVERECGTAADAIAAAGSIPSDSPLDILSDNVSEANRLSAQARTDVADGIEVTEDSFSSPMGDISAALQAYLEQWHPSEYDHLVEASVFDLGPDE